MTLGSAKAAPLPLAATTSIYQYYYLDFLGNLC